MVFSSITFLLYYFPIVFIVYYILAFSRTAQNIWLLLASLLFYAWGEPVYVVLMVFSILFNYIMGLVVNKSKKKINIVITCLVNLGILGFYKYSDFVIELINSVFGETRVQPLKLPLPIGISFYTFQALSYVIDVYKEKAEVQKNPLNLGLYISFFPQLVAGPIVRYTTVEKQIRERKSDFNMITEGICRFAEGIAKKVLIANNMAAVADQIFALSSGGDNIVKTPVMLAWLGAFAYMLQLYYDFSAYSDMAIGLGKMFGFQFPENFRYPFMAKSIREFMTKWHISLATWFNQYVYKPLGGSKSDNKDKMIRNLFIVWLLTGIWHGAGWTFIWWGLTFFAFILLENFINIEKSEGHEILRHIYVWVVVLFAMVIFRSDSGAQLIRYIGNMFGMSGNGFYSSRFVMFLKEYGIIFATGILFLFPVREFIEETLEYSKKNYRMLKICWQTVYIVGMLLLTFFSITVLAKGGYNPFIYFNF